MNKQKIDRGVRSFQQTLGRLACAALVVAATSATAYAQKWDLPTRSNSDNYLTQNIKTFADDISAATEGKLSITLHPEDSLIKQPDVKRAIRSGQVAIGEVQLAMFANEDPLFEIAGLPFLTPTLDDSRRLLTISRPYLDKALDKQDIMLMIVAPVPPNSFYTKKPVSTLEDFSGVRLRAYNAVTARMGELMGAAPVTVQQSEVSQAFSTGVIDAMMTSPMTGIDTHAWEFAKYYYDSSVVVTWHVVIMDKRVFAKLDKKTQDVVLTAAKVAEDRAWKRTVEVTQEQIDVLRKNGITVEKMPAALEKQLEGVGDKLLEEWLKSTGTTGAEIIEKYRQKS